MPKTSYDIVWDYIYGQAHLACLTLDSLAYYDTVAPVHPRHESPDHWPEGWNPPILHYCGPNRFVTQRYTRVTPSLAYDQDLHLTINYHDYHVTACLC